MKISFSRQLCEVCNQIKNNLSKIRTYNGKYLYACNDCKKDMATTATCLKVSMNEPNKSKKFAFC